MENSHAEPSDFTTIGFEKIRTDLRFLVECFREVLVGLGDTELAKCVPWLEDSEIHEPFPKRMAQVYSIAFQLLNIVEENTSSQIRRLRESELGAASEPGLWAAELQRLQRLGTSGADLAGILREVEVEPVLTAHPTEAKRSTVLEQLRELYQLMLSRENSMWTPRELQKIREDCKATLERLWRTGEIPRQKPEVADERRNVMHYLHEVFPKVVPRLDRNLELSWAEFGFDPALLEGEGTLPALRFGTWVGGDRDGHPFVTAEVTRETLLDLRRNALTVIDSQLERTAHELGLSQYVYPAPGFLMEAIQALAKEVGPAVAEPIFRHYPDEPWRQFVRLMQNKIPLERSVVDDARLSADDQNRYRFPQQLRADLRILYGSLLEVGAIRLAKIEVRPIMRTLEVFGFHSAVLDIRQNSAFHEAALSQMMSKAGLPGHEFIAWNEAQRLEFLNKELKSPRPFLLPGVKAGTEADALLDCYRVLADHRSRFGADGLGALIVSMTRSVSDLLMIYLFCREAGLVENSPEGLACLLAVVPLFETTEDLEKSPGIIREFLDHDVTRRSLHRQHALRPSRHPLPVQQVMVGYSDSNKEGGILASQWALQMAQESMTAIGTELGCRIRFFHGRGGTISRGAGPTHRFLDALPTNTLNGDIRLTEQGETIAQKYANLGTATYNLELLLAGVTGVTARQARVGEVKRPLKSVVNRLSNISRDTYQAFLKLPEFMDFYSQATPIDALERSSIGSRPSRRTGQRKLSDLRAIPWVFSWNQSRYYLPGWFGVGSALAVVEKEDEENFIWLSKEQKNWPFLRFTLTNVETNLASADLPLMEKYASLVPDTAMRDKVFGIIRDEFLLTQTMIEKVLGSELTGRRPRFFKTLAVRAHALQMLHEQQIVLLRDWRKLRSSGDTSESDALLPDVMLSINAIAAGLRTTG
ncbi:MAG: phosphoenolpyruvate carboxylase [Chthoniobacterales bacterium]